MTLREPYAWAARALEQRARDAVDNGANLADLLGVVTTTPGTAHAMLARRSGWPHPLAPPTPGMLDVFELSPDRSDALGRIVITAVTVALARAMPCIRENVATRIARGDRFADLVALVTIDARGGTGVFVSTRAEWMASPLIDEHGIRPLLEAAPVDGRTLVVVYERGELRSEHVAVFDAQHPPPRPARVLADAMLRAIPQDIRWYASWIARATG